MQPVIRSIAVAVALTFGVSAIAGPSTLSDAPLFAQLQAQVADLRAQIDKLTTASLLTIASPVVTATQSQCVAPITITLTLSKSSDTVVDIAAQADRTATITIAGASRLNICPNATACSAQWPASQMFIGDNWAFGSASDRDCAVDLISHVTVKKP